MQFEEELIPITTIAGYKLYERVRDHSNRMMTKYVVIAPDHTVHDFRRKSQATSWILDDGLFKTKRED